MSVNFKNKDITILSGDFECYILIPPNLMKQMKPFLLLPINNLLF